MLRYFDSEDRTKSESPTGYIQSEIVMVAKTGKMTSVFGGDSPSSMSNNGKLDWSPGEVIPHANSMDMYIIVFYKLFSNYFLQGLQQ